MTNQPPPPEELVSSETRIGQCLPTWSIHPAAAELGDVAALADHAMALRAALAAATARAVRAGQALARWKVCENCGEALTAPGMCDRAVTEREKVLELMHEETLTRAESAEAQLAALSASLEQIEQEMKRLLRLTEMSYGPLVDRWPHINQKLDEWQKRLAVLRTSPAPPEPR